MKKLNRYYLISIVTLVLMALIFMLRLQVSHLGNGPASPAQRLLEHLPGRYQSTMETEAVSFHVSLMDSLGEAGWLEVSKNAQALLAIRVSDFEDDQILLELFLLDSTARTTRMEGCEILLVDDPAKGLSGETLGGLCAYSANAQTFQKLKIFLANSHARVDIETWNAIKDSLIEQTSIRLEKEVPL